MKKRTREGGGSTRGGGGWGRRGGERGKKTGGKNVLRGLAFCFSKSVDTRMQIENSNSKTLFYKDCSLGSVKTCLTTSPV